MHRVCLSEGEGEIEWDSEGGKLKDVGDVPFLSQCICFSHSETRRHFFLLCSFAYSLMCVQMKATRMRIYARAKQNHIDHEMH